MKTQVILFIEKPKNIIEVPDVDCIKCFGTEDSIMRKGFITQENYKNGNFLVRSADNITVGNSYSHHNSSTLEGALTNCLHAYLKVYQFDTEKELFAWLAE